jgi:hypothetical protein
MTDHETRAHQTASRQAERMAERAGCAGAYEARYTDVMQSWGYSNGGPCTCDEQSHDPEDGHLMSCGWTLKTHRPERVKALEGQVYGEGSGC